MVSARTPSESWVTSKHTRLPATSEMVSAHPPDGPLVWMLPPGHRGSCASHVLVARQLRSATRIQLAADSDAVYIVHLQLVVTLHYVLTGRGLSAAATWGVVSVVAGLSAFLLAAGLTTAAGFAAGVVMWSQSLPSPACPAFRSGA
jgi:hypothetical protein